MHVNNDFQRNSNFSKVLEIVWKNPGFSRIDIARTLELYRSTVSNIIGTLVEKEVICEGELGAVADKGGRKPVLLSLNGNFGSVIGIEIQLDFYRICVLSFDGTELFSSAGETPFSEDLISKPEELFVSVVDKIVEANIDAINALPISPLALCIGIPGIIDVDKGIVRRSAPFRLVDFDYAQTLGSRYGIPLFIENDAKCCSWLELALNRFSDKKDFICVLARNYSGNEKLQYPENYGKGIGIGLSICMNAHVVNGRNYAVGEYISRSWTSHEKGQTGLPEAVIQTVNTVDDSYREWVKDLFSTLTITVPLLEPEVIFMHGQPASRKDFILKIIKNDVPQFNSIMASCGCSLEVMEDDKSDISKGAAFMFIQRLFDNQMLSISSSYSQISWDALFAIHEEGKTKTLFHKA